MAEIKIKSINDLLKEPNLKIPGYQRPYKWNKKNIEELLSDIKTAIIDNKPSEEKKKKYRIGTIILHKNKDEKGKDSLDIVDGQQRIISLVLLKKVLSDDFNCSILNSEFNNKTSQVNIHTNYNFIREWVSVEKSIIADINDAFENILEVVVIKVEKLSEAFQLFDSQNARGKALDPHDLLKAYHLREMRNYPYEMEHAVTKWEAKKTEDIRDLFDNYLFPIWNWAHGIKSRPFTDKEIDTYKGISEMSTYTYARRASKAMPYFQITEPFISGNDFFEMVDHYLLLRNDIKKEIENNGSFKEIWYELEENKNNDNSTGFGYAKNLFYCALLCYYDKFHNFDEMAVKKLFIWALMIRVDMEHLGFDSINKYAIGEENEKYTNTIAMFSKISLSRMHTEISSLQIETRKSAKNKKWNNLLEKLNGIIGKSEGNK